MNKQNLIEEFSVVELEQRIEFGCFGGGGGDDGGEDCRTNPHCVGDGRDDN